MYEFIEGQLDTIHPTYLVINNNGIGYRITVANPYRWQENLSKQVKVYLEQVVREDSHKLYGFKDEEEKDLFNKLNKVSGIGPKSAMSIMAIDDHDGLINAIETGDSVYLTKFPGVGKKTAQQMILDLKGELKTETSDNSLQALQGDSKQHIKDEILEALVGLGYSQREIKKVETAIRTQGFTSTQEGLSFAFKLLLKV